MSEPHPPIEILTFSEKQEYLPVYSSKDASGADAHACISEAVIIGPSESLLISTGLKCEIPKGYEIQVRPRSGLALKNQITVLNTPGTIDADYRGVIGVILINHGKKAFIVTPGMRIAQLVVTPVIQASFRKAEELSETARGAGGFGHTGVN